MREKKLLSFFPRHICEFILRSLCLAVGESLFVIYLFSLPLRNAYLTRGERDYCERFRGKEATDTRTHPSTHNRNFLCACAAKEPSLSLLFFISFPLFSLYIFHFPSLFPPCMVYRAELRKTEKTHARTTVLP